MVPSTEDRKRKTPVPQTSMSPRMGDKYLELKARTDGRFVSCLRFFEIII